MDSAPRSTFGPYTLIREVARGGMGIVYEAEDLAGIRVALKLPRAEFASDPHERARFVQEMRLTASLHHPNIVQVLQGGDDRGYLYLAMEYVDGTTLRQEIDRRGRLHPLEVVRIAGQVAQGLAAAHDHQPSIVHRDLKPGNILLRIDGVAKVTDFGIAKAFDVGAEATTSPMGTPVYMSPEQLNGQLSSPASDVHALGVILYEAITGIPPFAPTLALARLIHAICFDVPPAVSGARGLDAAVGADLDALVADCLAKAPERRPTASVVAARLRAIEHQLVAGRPPEAPPLVPHADPGTGAGVGAPGLDTIALVQRFEAPTSKGPVLAGIALAAAAGIGLGGWLMSNRESTADASEPGSNGSTSPFATALVGALVECATQTALADAAPLRMICVRSGSFAIPEPADDPSRTRSAQVDAFLISATEVTQSQWAAVMGDEPFDCTVGCGPDLPAQNITWTAAIGFANRLSTREGLTPCYTTLSADATPTDGCNGYRLPTETEWEFAARAGTTTRFSFGDAAPQVIDHAWYDKEAAGQTHPVGTKRPNPWGLFDVHGNVWEMVSDWHAPFGDKPADPQFAGPASGEYKVIRGGSFKHLDGGPQSAARGRLKPGGFRESIGLRVARSPRGRSFEFVSASAPGSGPASTSPSPLIPSAPPSVGAVTAGPSSACEGHAGAWVGSWQFATFATESTTAAWIGGEARYAVDLTREGCTLRGTAVRTQGRKQTSLSLTGVVDDAGGARIDYEPDVRGGRGVWVVSLDGTGTFSSKAGDVSGAVRFVRRADEL